MGSVVIRPNQTISNSGFSIVGAGSVHDALSDSSDASFVWSDTIVIKSLRVAFPDPSIPADAAPISAVWAVRVSRGSVNDQTNFVQILLDADGPWSTVDIRSVPWTSPTTIESSPKPVTSANTQGIEAEILVWG